MIFFKFLVDYSTPSLHNRKTNEIPETVYFPIEKKVNNTYIFSDKFFEPEKKQKTCEFYEKGLYEKEDTRVSVETKFYILYATKVSDRT